MSQALTDLKKLATSDYETKDEIIKAATKARELSQSLSGREEDEGASYITMLIQRSRAFK